MHQRRLFLLFPLLLGALDLCFDLVLIDFNVLFLLLLLGSCAHNLYKVRILCHEVIKSIDGLDLSLVHPDDPIATAEYVELMSSKNTTLVFEQTADGVVHDVTTDVCVDSTQRVIHEDDVRVEVDGSSNIHTLLLATRHCNTTLSNLRRIVMR